MDDLGVQDQGRGRAQVTERGGGQLHEKGEVQAQGEEAEAQVTETIGIACEVEWSNIAPRSRQGTIHPQGSRNVRRLQWLRSQYDQAQAESISEVNQMPISLVIGTPGSGRLDPFLTFAKPPTPREEFLINYYLSGVLSYFEAMGNLIIHPPRDMCFRTNVQAIPSLNAMYAYTSRHLASRCGAPDNEARAYRVATIRALNEVLSNPSQQLADTTILAVTGLITSDRELKPIDRRAEAESEVRTHLMGLRQLINARGGFPAIANCTTISWIVHWVDILSSGQLSASSTPLSVHAFEQSQTSRGSNYAAAHSAHVLDIVDFCGLIEEYVGAYRDFFWEAHARSVLSRHNSNSCLMTKCVPIHCNFEHATIFGRFLNDRDCGMGVGRIVALLYLNILLWDYRPSSSLAIHRYFNRLKHALSGQGLDLGGSLELFLWVLITDLEKRNVESPERVWLLARLLFVHARLPYDFQLRVEGTLHQFLISGTECSGESVWLPEQFRLETMQRLGLSA